MNVSIETRNGVTNIELYGNDEKEIAVLTSVFNQSSLNRAFRFRARPVKVQHNGRVCAVVISNDPYLTKKYLTGIGFFCYVNKRVSRDAVRVDGMYYVRGNVVLYNRTNSNVYTVYGNAKVERVKPLRPNKPYNTYSLAQVDTSSPIAKKGQIRKASELDGILTY